MKLVPQLQGEGAPITPLSYAQILEANNAIQTIAMAPIGIA